MSLYMIRSEDAEEAYYVEAETMTEAIAVWRRWRLASGRPDVDAESCTLLTSDPVLREGRRRWDDPATSVPPSSGAAHR